MKVEILLITYNQSQYIRKAIKSILMQRINDIAGEKLQVKVLVADDASTDDTIEIIRSYEKQSPFPFVYLPHEPNMGHILNYKRAFAACDGDYVCVLEGDDWWSSPYHIQKHIQFLDEHRECAMTVNRLAEYYPQKSLYSIPRNKYDKLTYYDVRDQIKMNMVSNHSSACYRTSLLKQLPSEIFNECFDDWLLGLYMSLNGFIVQLPDVTSVYRVHSEGVYSGNTENKHNELRLKRFEIAIDLFPEYEFELRLAKAAYIKKRSKHKISVLNYIPPILIDIYHWLVPPAIRRKF